ncbi:MAG: hypothetical protein AVDCRST_MAG29-1859, partial [uncultured Nocardioidaceae bacterium]
GHRRRRHPDRDRRHLRVRAGLQHRRGRGVRAGLDPHPGRPALDRARSLPDRAEPPPPHDRRAAPVRQPDL